MMGFAITINKSEAEGLVGPEEMHQKNQWVQEHLLDAKPKLLFSFVYGKQGSHALLTAWPKKTEIKQLDGAFDRIKIQLLEPVLEVFRHLVGRALFSAARFWQTLGLATRMLRTHSSIPFYLTYWLRLKHAA